MPAQLGSTETEIGEQLRAEMGGQRSPNTTAEVFEPADPARTMPKWLVFGTIVAVIVLVLVMSWLNRRSLDQSKEPAVAAAPAQTPAVSEPRNAPAATAPRTKRLFRRVPSRRRERAGLDPGYGSGQDLVPG